MLHLHFSTTHKMVFKTNCFILSHFYYTLLKQIMVRKRNDCDTWNRRLTSIYLLLPYSRFHRFKRKKRWIRLSIPLGTHALVIEKDPTLQYNVINAVIIMYKVLWENQRERLPKKGKTSKKICCLNWHKSKHRGFSWSKETEGVEMGMRLRTWVRTHSLSRISSEINLIQFLW